MSWLDILDMENDLYLDFTSNYSHSFDSSVKENNVVIFYL